jgi:hypothetical protein
MELVPEKEVLDFKLAPRPEQVGDKRREQLEDPEHRSGSCADSPSPRESAGSNFRERQVWRR